MSDWILVVLRCDHTAWSIHLWLACKWWNEMASAAATAAPAVHAQRCNRYIVGFAVAICRYLIFLSIIIILLQERNEFGCVFHFGFHWSKLQHCSIYNAANANGCSTTIFFWFWESMAWSLPPKWRWCCTQCDCLTRRQSVRYIEWNLLCGNFVLIVCRMDKKNDYYKIINGWICDCSMMECSAFILHLCSSSRLEWISSSANYGSEPEE